VDKKEVSMKILVACASRHGATQGIAERIGQVLERHGLEVTVRPIQEADALEQYDAFVIGSAAYAGGWLGEATTFVRGHRSFLESRPVWLFSSGPVGPDKVDAKGLDLLLTSEPKEFGEFERAIHPRDKEVFFGAYDPDQAPIGVMEGLGARIFRLIPEARAALPAGDYRDWEAIEAWANGIARELGPVPVGSS
jgi:menaquinone-dependent protoporphyrinogen oxidase